MLRWAQGALLLTLASCGSSTTQSEERAPSARSSAAATRSSPSARSSAEAATVASASGIADSAAPPRAAKALAHAPFTPSEVVALLYPEGQPETHECDDADPSSSIHCWIRLRYGDDAKGLATALAFYDELGAVPGLEREHVMEGGFRGEIHIVPERPIGPYQKHFDWVLEAQRDIRRVFGAVEAKAGRPIGYRSQPIGWKFLRSVGRTTPSAYANDWRVGYNVSGSLNTSMRAVRDTLVHEVFHLNDEDHGDWSRKVLGARFDSIVARCGTKLSCLAPYAPMKTTVRGGTYYAFQPDNGDAVHEYAAELASRYFLEARAALDGKAYGEASFKCGPPENAEAWSAIVGEFFGGVDPTPACGR